MKLLQMWSEEINEFWKSSWTASKALEWKAKMSGEFIQVFNLCEFVFAHSKDVNNTLLIEAIKLYAEYTTWFPLEYVFNDKIIQNFFQNLITIPASRTEIITCFGQMFSVNIPSTTPNFFNVKNMIMEIYKNFLDKMYNSVTGKINLYEKSTSIDSGKLSGFERWCLQFENALINFFKTNFEFIEKFDILSGTGQTNDFLANYVNVISLGLEYLTQFLQFSNEEIFKAACDFWYWFAFKLCFLKEPNIEPDTDYTLQLSEPLSNYIWYTNESLLYNNYYSQYIDKVREIIARRMTKPLEVKINIDEFGDITTDPTTNTIYQSWHDTMKDTLIFLTHLNPIKTEITLENFLNYHLQNSGEWNKGLLSSISWSIGCIAGAMEENLEKKFVVLVIKTLLTLCEKSKGKDNKAICASNIMYVIGQYPRFLNEHWKFLKTVIKKWFEFMHESHPGVQDFACETFWKISMKCGMEFIIVNKEEDEPYINTLVRTVDKDTCSLFPHQKLMFYEALGNMINHQEDQQKKIFLIEQLLSSTYSDWWQIFENAGWNPECLHNREMVKALELIIRINERVVISTKTEYWAFGSKWFDNMLKCYIFYVGLINNAFNSNAGMNINIKTYQTFIRSLLKFFSSLITNVNNKDIIMNDILPGLGKIIEEYGKSHLEARDAIVLEVFSSVLKTLKNTQYNYIVAIWNCLCMDTLNMIKNDYLSFPEHRIQFFKWLKELISNAFDAWFQIQESQFNKDVIDSLTWAIRHNQSEMYETGLVTLLNLLKNISMVKLVNNVNIVDPFFKAYFFSLFNDVFYVWSDSYHKGGFKLQVSILRILIMIVEENVISEGIFEPNTSNKTALLVKLSTIMTQGFQNLNKTQIETFCLALFNKCSDEHQFKVVIRDFLVNLKSFSGNNEELFEEEKKKELDEASLLEQKKKNYVPGMNPIYDKEMQMKYNSMNYQEN